jgi:peroxiredoxin
MAKAYGMWAGEEPYNCTKRGTEVIDKDGRISYYEEVPMREPRKVEDLRKAVAIEVAKENREHEFGQAV